MHVKNSAEFSDCGIFQPLLKVQMTWMVDASTAKSYLKTKTISITRICQSEIICEKLHWEILFEAASVDLDSIDNLMKIPERSFEESK